MSTPAGPGPAQGPPPDERTWGRPPAGGWGGPQPEDQGQFGQLAYGQAPSGQASYRQPPQYGQPPYGEQPYGAPQYGPPQYGPPLYDQGRHGQPPHDAPQYGQPQQSGAPYSQEYGQRYSEATYGPPTQQYPGPSPGWARPGHDPDGSEATGRRRARPLILGGVAAVVLALVAVLAFATPGFLVTRIFDAAAVQTGVERVLTGDYGLANVRDVTCAEGVEVAEGATFTCRASVDGKQVTVPVRITSKDGAYEVGRPT